MSALTGALQDRQGYLWYATPGCGLCRDDGYHIDVFRSDRLHPGLIANNDVLCIAENKVAEQIWFGTRAGAYVLDKHTYAIHPLLVEGHELNRHIENILSASDGTMWLPTKNEVLHLSAQGTLLSTYNITWMGRPVPATKLIETHDGDILVTHWNAGWGIIHLKGNRAGYHELAWEEDASPAIIVYDQQNGYYWVGTWGGGIVRADFQGDLVKFNSQAATKGHTEQDRQILSLLVDSRRNLLWSMSMSGLKAYDLSAGELFPADPSVQGPQVEGVLSDLYTDRSGNIYITGFNPQTFIITRPNQRVQSYAPKQAEDDTSLQTSHIVVDGRGNQWLWCDRNQLTVRNGVDGTYIYGVRDDSVTYVIAASGHGGVWATTTGGSIMHLEVVGQNIVRRTVLYPHEDVLSLADDGQGRLYIGTTRNLLCWEERMGRTAVADSATGYVRDIKTAADGRLYYISTQRGLCLLEPGTRNIAVLAPYQQFNKVAPGARGEVWVSSTTGSVYRFDSHTRRLVESAASSEDGDAVKSIAFDGRHLWAITDQILCEFDPASGEIRLLNATDWRIGLGNFTCIAASDGGAWVGGSKGLCQFLRSDELGKQQLTEDIVMSAYRLSGVRHCMPVGQTTLRIPPRESAEVELFLTSFRHLSVSNIRFAFRLQGLSNEWVTLDKGQNSIRLISLPKGKYTLYVKATNADGVWCKPVQVATMQRLPFWWETWWARCLYAVLVLFLLYAIYANYRRQRRRREQFDRLLRLLREQNSASQQRVGHREISQESEMLVDESIHLSAEDSQTLGEAIRVVEQHLDDTEYDVDRFARDMLMSRTTLFRRIRAVAGQSPADFIKTVRLERAAQLLLSSSHSIAAIADLTGFSSPSYFSKCFRQKYGVLPKHYKG